MSNVIAGVIRGQYPYLEEHIAQKKAIYERYKEGLKELPVHMNPIVKDTEPNYWLSAMIIDKDYMCRQIRDDSKALYIAEDGKTCPDVYKRQPIACAKIVTSVTELSSTKSTIRS